MKKKKIIIGQGLKISTRRMQLNTTIGTYRRMCKFGGGECHVIFTHNMQKKEIVIID